MINRVILEGKVTWSSWGQHKENGAYFINIMQEQKMINNFKYQNSFSAYANRPLAASLAKAIESQPNCNIYVEGKLRTFYSNSEKKYRTTVLIEKFTIINSSTTTTATGNGR